MMKNLTIKTRLYIVALILIVFSLLMALFMIRGADRIKSASLTELNRIIQETQKEKIKVATHTVAETIAYGISGMDSMEKKVEFIRAAIDPIRFENDESGYYFVYKGTVNVAHPMNKSLIDKDLSDMKDSLGVYPIRVMAEESKNGGGFCFFMWDKPGKGQTQKLGYAEMIPGTDFWIGTGVYLDNIEMYEKATGDAISASVKSIIGSMAVIALVVFILILAGIFSIIKGVTRSIDSISSSFQKISDGDLTFRINSKSSDELGALSRDFDNFTAKLNETVKGIIEQSRVIDSQASNLAAISKEMTGEADAASGEANKAATAANNLSHNMGDIAVVIEQASQNVHHVATATEEMSATIREISAITEDTSNKTHTASLQARDAATQMALLGEATREISKVTESIQEINDQTNLLALNATIEASRAGDAGKGFAVVAGEIKSLAHQTAESTEEIKKKVEGIQATTAEAISIIKKVEELIGLADDSVVRIRTAVDEQSAATNEISSNIAQTDSGFNRITDNVSGATSVAQEMAEKAELVFRSAENIASNSRLVDGSAEELGKTSASFNRMTAQFRTL